MSAAQETMTDAPRKRVLVVDDQGAIREIFKYILSSEIPEIAVDEAENGADALAQIEKHSPNVIVLDLHMPVMDGLTLFSRLRQQSEDGGAAMPHIVFCTGFAPPQSIIKIVREGNGHALLTKPVSSRDLVAAVRDRLE